MNLVFLYSCMLDTRGSGFFIIQTRRLWRIFQCRFDFSRMSFVIVARSKDVPIEENELLLRLEELRNILCSAFDTKEKGLRDL